MTMDDTPCHPRQCQEKPVLNRPALDPALALMAAGAVLVVVGFFLPWLSSGAGAVSGWRLAVHGYPFLFALPILAAGAALALRPKTEFRPLTVHAISIAGLFCLIALVSLVMETETGPLVLFKKAGKPIALQMAAPSGPITFTSASALGWGLAVLVLGLVLIYIADLTRPAYRRPDKLVDEACRPRESGQAESLEDLKPRWTLSGEYHRSLLWLAAGAVLITTYFWCGISPVKLWHNRHHARDYLLGRPLSASDRAYIEDQVNRAPSIEAQGLARAFQDNKYRDVPMASQPMYQEKMKENKRLAEEFLSKMSPAEKKRLRERARQIALVEKKGGYFPPETAWTRLKGYLVALLETVAIAIWGTLLAIVCAVPVSLLAAKNTLTLIVSGDGPGSRVARRFCIFGVRRFLDACRGFNEFVMALIFVAVIGLGPFAGILALWIHTFGILGKVFSEQIEAIEGGQVEALSSTGAGVDQVIVFSVLPQIMPGMVSYSLLRFESNVRSAAILGFVGAGGIGFLIFDKLNGYLFREVCTMMIIIIISVGIIDFFCGKLRRRFI